MILDNKYTCNNRITQYFSSLLVLLKVGFRKPLLTCKYANKNIDPGFGNVHCETSVYQYPGLSVNFG